MNKVKDFIKENWDGLFMVAVVLFMFSVFSVPFWVHSSDRRIYKELNKHATEIVIDTNNFSWSGNFYGTLYDKDSTVICKIRFKTYSKNVDVKYDEGKYLNYDLFGNDQKLYEAVAKLHGFEDLHNMTKKDFYKKLK